MFGKKLQQLRKEKGVSQEELSEILDVSRQSISKYENETAQPSFEKLLLLSKYFEVSVDELLGNVELKQQEKILPVTGTGNNKILIISQIDNKASSFYKFILSPVFGRKEYHPEILLMGVDGHSFWGDSAVTLGWYATKEDAEKELADILKAMSTNEATYELKYYVKVKKKGFLDFEIDEK